MKKSKLLILFPVMGLFLSGCTFQEGLQSTKSWINSHIYQPLKSFFSSSSTPSEEGKKDEEKKEEEKKDEGKVFSWEDYEKSYADAGFTGVEIPDYKCASADASLTQPYPEDEPDTYVIKGSSAAEMKAFVDSFGSAWYKETDSYGDYHILLGGMPDEGESTPYIYVGDYTAEAAAGIMIAFDVYETPVSSAEFPLSDLNGFLTTYSSVFGFTLSQAEGDALTALSTSFVFQSGESSYGPVAQIAILGDVASDVLSVIDATVTGAGYTYYEGYGYYDAGYTSCIAAEAEEGYTYLMFQVFAE